MLFLVEPDFDDDLIAALELGQAEMSAMQDREDF